MKVLKSKGLSPVVGLILLIGLTVAISTITGVVLFDIGKPNNPVQAGVEISETPEGVEISWMQSSTAEKIDVRIGGETIATLGNVNEKAVIGAKVDEDVSVIGVDEDGNEQVVTTETTDYDTGSNELIEYQNLATTVSGQISINPNLEGVIVRSVEDGNVIDTDTTDSTGNYNVSVSENSRLHIIVDGITYNGSPLYTSSVQDVPDDQELNVDFDETKITTINPNGTELQVLNSKSDGYVTVSSIEQIQVLGGSENVKMLRDIDATKTEEWNGGSGFNPIGSTFTGEFRGNGYEVQNLTINRPNMDDVGLFRKTDTADITNLTLTNVDISGKDRVGAITGESNDSTYRSINIKGKVSGSAETGGFIGLQYNTIVKEVSVQGTVDGTQSTGGILGAAYNSKLTNSYSTASVTSTGGNITGGLVGAATDGTTIENSYATGDITGERLVGGSVGSLRGSIKNSYATGDVTSDDEAAGVIGIFYGGQIKNVYATGKITGPESYGVVAYTFEESGTGLYWNTETTGQTSDAIAPSENGLTTSEMSGTTAPSNMTQFSFTDKWTTTTEYPKLQD